MTFSIRFEGLIEIKNEDFSETCLSGVICLGEFQEKFASSLSYWKRDDYEAQWKEGVERILSGDFISSAIVVDIMSPEREDSILTWWPMYLDGDCVCFHEQFLILNKLPQGFQRKNLYSYIQPRHIPVLDPSELPSSEWIVETRELREWIAKK